MREFDLQQGDLDELANSVLLISASAGTGKTWTITHLATRWLLTEPNSDPSQLLMVTFSRAAAAELKARLRKRVVEVGRILEKLEDPAVSDRWARNLMETASESDIGELLRRQRRVLSRLDEVNARTIHSFVASATDSSSGEQTAGNLVSERAVNEAMTGKALRQPELLRTLLPDPMEPTLDPSAVTMKPSSLRTNLISVISSSLALGGLAPSDGRGSSKAIADLGSPDEEGAARAASFLDLVIEAEFREALLNRLESTTTFSSLIASMYWEVVRGGDHAIERLRRSFSLVLIDEFQDTDLAQWEIFERVFVGHVPMVIVGDPKQAIYGFRGGDVVIFQDLLTRAHSGAGTYRSASIVENYRSGPDLLGCLNALFLSGQAPQLKHYFETVPTKKPLVNGLAHGWGFSTTLETAPAELDPIVYDPVRVGERTDPPLPGRFIIRDVSEKIGLAALDDGGRRPEATLASLNPPSVKSATAKQAILDDLVHYLTERVGHPSPGGSESITYDDVLILVRTNSFATKVRDHLRKNGIPAITNKTESVWISEAATQLRSMVWILADPLNPRRTGLLRYTWFRHHDPDSIAELAEIMAKDGPSTVARRLLNRATTKVVLSTEEPERSWTDLDHVLDLVGGAFHHGVDPAVVLSWLDGHVADAKGQPEDQALARRIESDGHAISIMTLHLAKGLERPIVLVPEIEPSPDSKDNLGTGSVISSPDGRIFELPSLSGSDRPPEFSRDVVRQFQDEEARLLYVGLTRARSELVVWLSDLNRHEYASPADPGKWEKKTSLWRLLVESYRLTTAEEADEMRASCDAKGAPYVRGIEFQDRGTGSRPAAITPSGAVEREINLAKVDNPPPVTSPLRRWSYSSLHVSGTSAKATEVVDEDEERSAYDAGVFAEDDDLLDDEAEGPTRRLGAGLFGGLSGNVVGTAIHSVYEDLVGITTSADADSIRTSIERAYRALSLPLRDLEQITKEFQATMAHPLGPAFQGGSLDDLATAGTPRVAREMRFTMPLLGPADGTDRLRDIGRLVADRDPAGPYAEFFGGLATKKRERSRLLQGFLTGSIDLVAKTDEGRYLVLDYKSNLLKDARTYRPSDLIGEMSETGYPLQGLLYSVALHRFLSGRLDGYSAETHLGGIAYYFVRGAALPGAQPGDGVAAWDFPASVVTGVSSLLANEELT